MKKIFKAHLKKQWTGFLTSAIFIVFASMMLTVGISLNMRTKTMFDEKVKDSNTAQNLSIVGAWDRNFTKKIEDEFLANENLADVNLSYEIAITAFTKENDAIKMYALKHDENKTVSKRIPFDVDHSITDGVYISTCVQDRFDVNVGDELKFITPTGEVVKKVKGLYEEYLLLWSHMVLLEADFFDSLLDYAFTQKNPDEGKIPTIPGVTPPVVTEESDEEYFYLWHCSVLEYNALDDNELTRLLMGINERYFVPLTPFNVDYTFNTWGLENTKVQLLSFANILSAMLIVFSFIMTLVSLIIIRFIIITNMEDDVKNIGIFKALGYTTSNLRTVIFTEYLTIGIIAAIVGALLSILVLPIFTNVIGMTIYFIWKAKITALGVIVGAILPPILISSIVWLITAKYKKITPVIALRSNTQTTKTKKNRMPLIKYDKATSLTLSIKSIVNGGKKWISIGVVMLVVSLFSVFTFILHYNANVDNRAFIGITGNQPADVMVRTSRVDLIDDIQAMPETDFISKAGFSYGPAIIESDEKIISANMKFYMDFSQTKLNVLYDGAYPANSNEIAITNLIADKLGFKIGDTFSVSVLGKTGEFKVVGICQNMSAGYFVYITGDGYRQYLSEGMDLNYSEYMIFTKKGTNVDAFFDKVDGRLTNYILGTNDFIKIYDKEANGKMYISQSILDGAKILTYAMDVLAAVAVFIILLFIIRLKLIREKKNIALNKALGVTTFGIMTEICVGTVIVIGISVVLGGILGALLSEKLLGIALSGYGIRKLSLIVPVWQLSLILLAIIAFAYIVSMLLSLATRKISPRTLQSN